MKGYLVLEQITWIGVAPDPAGPYREFILPGTLYLPEMKVPGYHWGIKLRKDWKRPMEIGLNEMKNVREFCGRQSAPGKPCFREVEVEEGRVKDILSVIEQIDVSLPKRLDDLVSGLYRPFHGSQPSSRVAV